MAKIVKIDTSGSRLVPSAALSSLVVSDIFTKFDAADMDKQIKCKLNTSSRLANAYAWKNRRPRRHRSYREIHRG